MPDSFPTYADWLSGHADESLVDLLWRLRAFHTGPGIGAGGFSTVSDVAALRQLTATELAVLHALVNAGAGTSAVDPSQVADTLGDLFDEAGTAPERRPDMTPDGNLVPRALRSLASWGLAFGPTLNLDGNSADAPLTHGPVMVPSHLPPLFAGATDLPWVLVDGYRCPIPTEELPGILGALPSRQRRLLDTLETSGGIGHSATLDDPERPLARMIDAGLLDRVDQQTARLSPRVAASISGRVVPCPGGDFRGPDTGDGADTASDSTDATAVARVVETVRLVADVLTETGRSPLRPLNAGGVGVREVSRLSKALALDAAVVADTLALCRHADLISLGLPLPAPQHLIGHGDFWSLTDRGARFLSGPLSLRWAMLLDRWRTSSHATWLGKDDGNTKDSTAHLLQESSDRPEAASLRGVVASGGRPVTAEGLWNLRPSVAAVTTTAALDAVVDETVILGLTADGQASSAAHALAGHEIDADEDQLAEALAEVLPAPVRMLIIQADMTILAPGLLDTDTEAKLRRFADIESTGMASVWRVTRESMQRAVEQGETAEGIEDFLAGMAPEVPQSLWYLIQDTYRTHRPTPPVVGGTAASVLTAPDEKSMASIMETDAAVETGLRMLSPTVAASSVQLSLVVEALEEEGVTISIDGDSGTGRATAGPVLSTVQDPERPAPSREHVTDQLAGAVEGFRRSRREEEDDSGRTGETVQVREPRAIMDALRGAYDAGTPVEISYVDAAGSAVRDWISVVTMSPVSIIGVTSAGGRSLQIQPHRIAWVSSPAPDGQDT